MFSLAQKKKISYVSYMRNKRELDALYALGYRYDVEKDPAKKEALGKEIIKRCDILKPKLGLKDLSDAEARELFGVSAGSTDDKDDHGCDEGQNAALPEEQGSAHPQPGDS